MKKVITGWALKVKKFIFNFLSDDNDHMLLSVLSKF